MLDGEAKNRVIDGELAQPRRVYEMRPRTCVPLRVDESNVACMFICLSVVVVDNEQYVYVMRSRVFPPCFVYVLVEGLYAVQITVIVAMGQDETRLVTHVTKCHKNVTPKVSRMHHSPLRSPATLPRTSNCTRSVRLSIVSEDCIQRSCTSSRRFRPPTRFPT